MEYVHFEKYGRHPYLDGGQILWFRGVSKSSYALIPGIYRKTVWDYDPDDAADIVNEFINKAKGYNKQSFLPSSKWEWYQVMQHHGLPTRLLDWTEGSLIALYFAVRNFRNANYPAVWMINPIILNMHSTNSGIFYTDAHTRNDEDKIIDSFLDDSGVVLPKYPVAFFPAYINERLAAQKSCFTIHGSHKTGFTALSKISTKQKESEPFVPVQLRISNKAAENILTELKSAGINETNLFPDLEGLARELCYQFLRP